MHTAWPEGYRACGGQRRLISYGILISVRRFIDLTRSQLLALLDAGSGPAQRDCSEAVRRGAAYRVNADTVSREGALRIYALRAQATLATGTPTVGFDLALKELSATPYTRLRTIAVSSRHDYVLFLDPECVEIIACIGVDGRTP